MADGGRDGAQRPAEDPDELFYTDLNDNSSVSGLDSPHRKLDHCDLLLDAIDAQLGQLQVHPHRCQAISRGLDCSNAALLRESQSLSKDTGLGSTSQTNDTPMSCLDLIHTPTMEQTSERSMSCWDNPVTQEESKLELDRRTRDKEEMESQREQVIWRLERLLGDTCNQGRMAAEPLPPSDSICTEDFVRCFREEMVEPALPESKVQQTDKEEEAESLSERKGQSVFNVDRRATRKSCEDTETAHYSHSGKQCQEKESERPICDGYGVNTSHGSERAGAGERHNTPQRPEDLGSISHRRDVVTKHEAQRQNSSHYPNARCLAGVPVRSFDTVSIDSDLDSVCTQQVRQHIRSQSGWRSLIRSVVDMDDCCITQSDYDTPTQEESKPQPASGQRSLCGNARNKNPSLRKAQRNKRETCRLVCSSGDNDKDTDEEMTHWRSRCKPERTSGKMQSDWAKMKEELSALRQKCESEQESLLQKRTELKEAELSLSELQQRKRNALQELERLKEETGKMEREKRTLEYVLRYSGEGKDSVGCRLQRQRESCAPELHKQPTAAMSVLEREEMDRQLDSAKTELFTEQRRAREQLESMQEMLEETREELQRVTEAESLLRRRFASLEETHRQKKDQLEAARIQQGELQGELGECKVRVGTLEKMLAQKELQQLDLQERRGVLQAERDGLKGALKHMETQHCSALTEAQEQACRRMEAALKQQREDLTLTHEQEIQKLKGEEAKKLRDSLLQQKQEAKKHEEELRVEALEKVHKAIEEERRKWEAEKVEAVQVHCGILEEQNRKSLESVRSEMQRERSKAMALQHKVMQLKSRVQEVESESCAQRREQESLLAVICKSLKEEHQAELQKLQKQMAQESQRTAQRLELAAQLAEKEAERLRVMLQETERSYNQVRAELDQQLRRWGQELGAECQHLQILVELKGAKQSPVQLPPSPTVAEALTNLTALREQLMDLVGQLHRELESQRQLRKDKERELSIQRQQLRMERDQALDSVKERLIQEHIEELSSLKWAHMCDGGAEGGGGGGGGAAASLRKQLKAKDLELRQVQRNMGQWKEQTAARLACKFEEELIAELERKKIQEERQGEPGGPDREMTLSAKEAQSSASSPSPLALAPRSPSDVASFKLLRYLQGKVRQLRLENQTCTWSPSPSGTIPLDLSGSDLRTITQGQAIAGIQGQSPVRTVSN